MIEADAIQRRWARVVGFSYLFALAPAVFAELYVSGRLVSDNAISSSIFPYCVFSAERAISRS